MVKKVFLVIFMTIFCFLLWSKEKMVNETNVNATKAVALSIENQTGCVISKLSVCKSQNPDKSIFDFTSEIQPGEVKTVDLEKNLTYIIRLFDKDNISSENKDKSSSENKDESCFKKKYLTSNDIWQKVTIEPKDYQSSKKTNKLKKIFGIGTGAEKSAVKTTAVILKNKTGENIDFFEIIQNNETITTKESIDIESQKSLDIQQGIDTDFIFYSPKKKYILFGETTYDKYKISDQNFNTSHKELIILKENLIKE